jgi:hypothetical protein
MGYYIETPSPFNKAEQIVATHDATIVSVADAREALRAGLGVVCVVQNAFFDAAAFAYSERELEEFADPRDHRPKTWIVMDRDIAAQLSGYKR